MTAQSSSTAVGSKVFPIASHSLAEGPISFGRTPFVVPKGAGAWATLSDATLDRLLARCGDTKIEARVDLPDDGVPYNQNDAKHNVSITLTDLGERIARGERCYGPQVDVGSFAGFQPSADLDTVLPPGFRVVNLWVGSRTKSGLHYDAMDNLFVQIDGQKHVMVAAPEDSRALYPFPDTPTKSRVDPERPDFAAFPRVSRARFLTATLEAGDMLFIPRGWWHFLSAPGPSVSLNCWFGTPMTPAEQMKAVTVTDPLAWGTILLDAVRYGLAGRPYPRRLLSSAPAGKALYELLASQMPWRKRKLR
jgi:lysine-specific demethylase 8